MAAKLTTVPTIPLSKVAAQLAEKTGMTKRDATGALDEFVGLVVKHLKKGTKVRITGLGILEVRHRPARVGRNPATGETVKIKASKKVASRIAADSLRESAAAESASESIAGEIIGRVEHLVGDRRKAEVWFEYQPLPAFESKTPRQLVSEGRANAVQLHLDTLEDGVYA